MKYLLLFSVWFMLLSIVEACRNEKSSENWLGSGYQILIKEFRPDSTCSSDASELGQCPYITKTDFGFKTTLINLLANSEKYRKKRVYVQGFLALGIEGDLLYLSALDYKNQVKKNAIGITIDTKRKNIIDSLNARYVTINGEFYVSDTGIVGSPTGGLKNISRIFYVR